MRTCESWAGAMMVPEGQDNIKGHAWFGLYTEQLALKYQDISFGMKSRCLLIGSLRYGAYGLLR
jgi:hypothetical protein